MSRWPSCPAPTNRTKVRNTVEAKQFRRRNFNGTRTRDIACAVGMHCGSLFCHFKSKDALLYEVLQELSSTGCRQVEVPLARHLIFGVLNGSAQWFIPKMGIID